MKKHGVIIDMINNFLAFWPAHYTHNEAISSTTLSQAKLPAEIVVIKIEKDITPQKMLKKGLKKKHDRFLANAK